MWPYGTQVSAKEKNQSSGDQLDDQRGGGGAILQQCCSIDTGWHIQVRRYMGSCRFGY